MTDKPTPKPELANAVKIFACDPGHVHVAFLREDGSEIATSIFEIDEAHTHAMAVLYAAHAAGVSAANVPGIVGGDVESHTKH
jgi:hypothetical protein